MNEELKIIITAEIDKLKSELQKGKKEVEGFGKEGKASFAKFNDGVQKAGDVAKKGLAVAGAAIAGATTALLVLSASTEEYRTSQSKLTAAFETAGASAETAKSTYNDLYRVLGDDGVAVEAANHLAKLTTNQQELEQWTTICQGVYATFGDSIPIEGLTEAVNETAKVGTLTGSLADALNWAGVNEDAFQASLDACNSEAEREALIRETLNGLYNDAASNYESTAGDILAQNEAQAKLNDSMARLGEAMAPVNTMLAEFGAVLLEELAPILSDLMENYAPQIEETLNTVASAIGSILSFIIENWELVATIAAVITGIAIALSVLSTALTVYNTVMGIASVVSAPVIGIIAAIVAAVAALIAIIVLCVKHWDEIKEAVSNAIAAIKETIQKGIDAVVGFFQKVINFVKENWQGLLLLIANPFAGAFKLLYDNCEGFKTTVDNACAAIKTFFANLWTNIKNIFSGVGNWFKGIFNTAVTNIKNVFNGIANFFSGVWNSIKSIFSNVGTAIGNAITNTVKTAINKVLSTAIKIINGFIGAINTAIGIINEIPGVNIKKLSKLEVPKLAKGGIIDSATLAMVGEQGKEAVVPLENNLGWLDKLATMLNDRMGGGSPIILQVDGKTFAQISVDSINQLTRQTGNLPLKLV